MEVLIPIGIGIGLMELFRNENRPVEQMTAVEITQGIIDRTVAPLSYIDHSYTTTTVDNNKYIDPHREYKDICTDMVVKHFMSTDRTMFNFLQEVYNTFDESIKYYNNKCGLSNKDVFFVYKGGNVLRIISNDFLRELPRTAAADIEKHYQKYFKRSDADFSIYINPELPSYDKVYNDMIQLSYHLQVKIRAVFQSRPTDFFEYYKYSTEYKQQILDEYLEKLKLSSSILNPENETYFNQEFIDFSYGRGKRDIGIEFTDQPDQVAFYELTTTENPIYIQLNSTLDFIAGVNRIKFALVRSKVNFTLRLKTKVIDIGGELIDVSIPHKFDHGVKYLFENLNHISYYELNYTEQDNQTDPAKFAFNGYSLYYLMHDLEYIVFDFADFPWKTPKYEKRLNRLFYLYFIDLFIQLPTMSKRKEVIDGFRNMFSTGTKPKLIKVTRSPSIYNLVAKYQKIQTNPNINIDENQVRFQEMNDILLQNCEFVLRAFENVESYCSVEGNIKMRVLYKNEFSSLI